MAEQNRLLKILCLGDLVGRPARAALNRCLPELRAAQNLDLVIANAENAAGGVGIDPKTALEIRSAGVDVITLGDHAWQRREIRAFLDKNASWCLRPANYAAGAPGRGWTIAEARGGRRVGVMNLIGRVFMAATLDCPFRGAMELLQGPLADCPVRVCDFHAEATSEKVAMGRFLDGRSSLVFGTHTHVQTADERILLGGTGYITDLGMCGSDGGVIGMDTEAALSRFLTGLPNAHKVAKGHATLHGVICSVDTDTGRAHSIERLQFAAGEDDSGEEG